MPSHVLLENVVVKGNSFVDWQRKGDPPHGPGWTAMVWVDNYGARVIDCKHGHFTRFGMPG